MQSYTASAKQNPGRKSWLVEFRHPLKDGKKVRKGLGTEIQEDAQALVNQLNQLLADSSLHSIGAENLAKLRFDQKIVDIFYSEVKPKNNSALLIRDELLPMPSHADGYVKACMMGVPGAGKSTLLRQIIGTHPKRERFPATSNSRTTTFPTEIILQNGNYQGVVTFLSEHETRFEVEESVISALIHAIDGNEERAARDFLSKSDMRFRLQYLLGEFPNEETDSDPYDDEEDLDEIKETNDSDVSVEEKIRLAATLQSFVQEILSLAQDITSQIERTHGKINEMPADDQSAAVDLILEQAKDSDQFTVLISKIMDEIREKFTLITKGTFKKGNTGWPIAWQLTTTTTDRKDFIEAVRFFSGISSRAWGKLLTPLVNGMRVSGPFKPEWWPESQPKVTLIDTEGLGHKASPTTDLSEQFLAYIHSSDLIILVDSAKNGMTNPAAGKVLEAVVHTGYINKLAVVFTHMDQAKGDNELKGSAKKNNVFNGLRNIVEHQLTKSISPENARDLLSHLDSSTFYVGKIDKFEPTPAVIELKRILTHIEKAMPAEYKPVAFPVYDFNSLGFAVQEATQDFHQHWKDIFNEHSGRKWHPIKKLSSYYGEGWDDGQLALRPASNLIAALSRALSRFLDNPIEWKGHPTDKQKTETISEIKARVTSQLRGLSSRRLREEPQLAWAEASKLGGNGSTFTRRLRIENIYARWVPIPGPGGDKNAAVLLNEIRILVTNTISDIEQKIRAMP